MRNLNAYFRMSTANPTGQRPWNFAMQNRALGFYVNDNFTLPSRSLGRLSGMPTLSLSKFSGKDPYGLSRPIYTPLSRNFLGAAYPYYSGWPSNTLDPWRRQAFWDPTASTTLQDQLAQSQQTVAQLTAQQAAYNMAQANASTPISTPAAPAASTVSNWFTDPSQEIISGIPNWGVVAAGAAAAFMLFGGKRR